jgi:hypothetical protein
MQSTYSFYGSQLHLVLDDEVAERYNRVSVAFANVDAKAVQANPTNTIWLEGIQDGDMEAWNAIADLMNKLIEINGGHLDIAEEEMPYNCLMKL